MPKDNKSNKNEKNLSTEAAGASTPADVYTPPTQPLAAEATTFPPEAGATTPVTNIAKRRLGTGAIIGIAAAGAALLAGVFGGGIALGATSGHDRAGHERPNMEQADGPMQGGPMQGGPIQGGPMQGGPQLGGPMQGGPGRDGDADGPMSGNMPHAHDANGSDIAPPVPGTSSGTMTTTPAPAN